MTPERSARVLIADADAALRSALHKRLADADVFADCVADGKEALEKLSTVSYAVVLLDLSLPVVGADRILEFIGRLRGARRPVVLALGGPGAGRSLDVEVVQIVLRKPFDLIQVSEIVRSCVRNVSHTSTSEPAGELPDDAGPGIKPGA